MTLLRRWRPSVLSLPIVLWLLGGLGYVLGWKAAGFVLQALALAAHVVVIVARNREDPWRSMRRAQRSLPPSEREVLKGYPSWW